MALADDQRGRLRQAKLAGLVRGHVGPLDDGEGGVPGGFPGGATLRDGDRGWVLIDDGVGPRSVGGALLWGSRSGITDLGVIVETTDGVLLADLARRASWFEPRPAVFRVAGTSLETVTPSDPPEVRPAPPDIGGLVDLLLDADLEVVVEHGIVRGEVLGLEVARIVTTPTGSEMDVEPGGPLLEVGVGKFDRVTAAMMYAHLPTAGALGAVIEEVRRHRYPGAPPHPVRDLCRERWLRHAVIADPAVLGLRSLSAVETTVERDSLREFHPAVALGTDETGRSSLVACTYGVDIDLLPMAADARAVHATDAALVIVAPEVLPDAIRQLAERLPGEVRFAKIAAPWS
ncbi:MAG TPA: hypothetical protein VJM33_08970 [Microthrixaceae bacterium]|nr:hypothetical protein [Microthrixaceae bacterium]